MDAPRPGRTYDIELCSGEHRRWRYLGRIGNGEPGWCDIETGQAFSESGLMYAWKIIAEVAAQTSGGMP